MISRRLLRVKVLQMLYAYYATEMQDITKTEKELLHSINKSYELYNLLLLLIIEISRFAADRIDIARNKIRPSFQDLNPNTRLPDNKLINQISCNIQLKKYCEGTGISWIKNPGIIKELYNEMIVSSEYIEYLNAEDIKYEDDKRIIAYIYTDIIQTNQHLNQVIEEMSIYWNDDLEYVISMIIKTIKKFKEEDGPEKRLFSLYKSEEDRIFAKDLFLKGIKNRTLAVKLIKKTASNWDIDRIAFMDILIMQLAISELIEFTSIPTRVSLNEYLDIARYYSTEKSNTFINGILDKILIDLRGENRIQKTGRGLMGEN